MAVTDRIEVLLVEDSPSDAQLIIEALSEEPDFAPVIRHVVRLADALAVVEVAEPSVIIYDLNLPDASGLEGIEALALHAPAIPLIVMTWRADDEVALGALRHRAQDYLVKDQLSPEVIRRTVRFALERHRLAKEARSNQVRDPDSGLLNATGLTLIGAQRIKEARRRGEPLLLLVFRWTSEPPPNLANPLARLATLVSSAVRESDVLARLDRDEICGLFFGSPDHPMSLESVRARLDDLVATAGDVPAVSISAVEWSVDRTATIDALLSQLTSDVDLGFDSD